MSSTSAQSLVFRDRRDAGVELASHLRQYAGRSDVVVLALPRGGVPVAFEVAEQLGAELNVFVVRKIGMPGHREYAVGAIASGGVEVLDRDILRRYAVPERAIDDVIREERDELQRREKAYRQIAPDLAVAGRVVILVDDGLATGSTMKAAARAVRLLGPSRVVVAVPVGAASSCGEIAGAADEVVCARIPEEFSAVGQWYLDFNQTSDEEVRALLADARRRTAPGAPR
jgi:putative phosphoribosyl transferase